jgi:cadmium resistance protein CadD (predicted permease)
MSLVSIAGLVAVGVIAFVTTNLDDMVVLLAFLADPRYRTRPVILGQYLGFTGTVVISVGMAAAASRIPPAWAGLMGLIPLAIGVRRLLSWGHLSDADDTPAHPRHTQVVTVTLVTIANGGDNIGLYTTLFAVSKPASVAGLAAVFYLMLALWCRLAHLLVRHPLVAAQLRRRGHLVVPWLYIALGLWLLARARGLLA